jgi:hypothetical protein
MPRLAATASLAIAILPGLVGLSARPAAAHAVLLYPIPRSSLTSKTSPCGGLRRGAAPLVLEAGSEVIVRWEEYVDHPGYYQVLFSLANDADFAMLLDRIPDRKPDIRAGERTVVYETTVALPDEPCDACTLLLIQVMTERPQSPSYYYSCADIQLVPPRPFRRGDASADGKVDLTDAIVMLEALFTTGEPPACADAVDANDDGSIDVSDPIAAILQLFRGVPALPAPGPFDCGEDVTPDTFLPCGDECTG